MAEVKWIKLTTDMFDNKKIRYLRTLPEGNNIVLIWVMLLTMAGRCNANGMIFLTENIPYTTKMLADELGFDANVVTVAINALSKLGMICANDDEFYITNWEEYQNIEGLEKIREQTRQRVANYRERKKIGNVTGNATVTQSNATDIDKEIDIDIKDILSYLNEKTGKNFRATSKETKRVINARLKEGYSAEDFKRVIDIKVAKWGNDPKMRDFLRPQTLFGTKFESYLNETTPTSAVRDYGENGVTDLWK